jgi:dipeptidyl aminopeptidase/acylaminoacyl peptidase
MEPLKPRDILEFRNIGQLALSPDGSRLAFVEMWADEEANANRMAIFLVPTDGSAPARRITSGPKRDWGPKWSPDGSTLAFLSVRETEWRADLYVMNMTGGGDPQLVATLPRGVAQFEWSPDSARFALTGRPAYPDDRWRPADDEAERRTRYQQRIVHVERMHYRADGMQLTDDEFASLWVVDGAGGEPAVVLESSYPLSSPGWTPDGRIAFVSSREPDYERTWNSQVWAVSPEGGTPEKLSSSGGAVQGYAFTDDGRLVYPAYPVPGLPVGCYDDQLWVDDAVVAFEHNVGKHVLADTVDPIAGGSTPTASGNDVFVQVSIEGATHVYVLRDGRLSPVIAGDRVIGEFAVAGDVIAFTSTSQTEPASIRVCRRDGSGERVVHDPNPWLAERPTSEFEEIWVDVDGVRSQAWVILPPAGVGASPPPCVLSIHGGPHGAYGKAFNLLLQMLAAPGYSVIYGNPPGSLTYGEKFAQLTHRAWGEADFPHVMAYCDEAIERGWADPDKLGVTGGSYGGFLTCWSITHTHRFKSALAARPPTNLTSIFGSSEFGWALMHGCFDAHPWEDRELFARLSPMSYVENIETPLRLIACTDDFRVPMEQVEQMYISLKILDRPVDMVVFRDSHHLIYTGPPMNRVAHMDVMVEWFGRYL